MARPPTDEQFTEFVHAAWPTLYRTAYLLVGERDTGTISTLPGGVFYGWTPNGHTLSSIPRRTG